MQPQGPGAIKSAVDRRSENLALMFQEIFTVIERLRSNRQAVSDAQTFRHQVREALKLADAEARKRGYSADDTQLAIFAVVAFLDETILNFRNPIFGDWPRQPLQEEFFGHHIAGEIFFQHLQRLLARNDSQDLADLLEVFYLCMLLGFAGRYSLGGRGELRGIMDATADKIRRIRGVSPDLSPNWALPAGAPVLGGPDPWVKRVTIGAVTCALMTLILFIFYKVSLNSGISSLETIATQGRG